MYVLRYQALVLVIRRYCRSGPKHDGLWIAMS